jgi:hypothetical protein
LLTFTSPSFPRVWLGEVRDTVHGSSPSVALAPSWLRLGCRFRRTLPDSAELSC